MKIISKFHDYYDSALAYGFEESLAYARATTTLRGSPTDPMRDFGPAVARLPAHLQSLTDWAALCASVDRLDQASRHLPPSATSRFRSTPLTFAVGGRFIKALWLRVCEDAPAGASLSPLSREEAISLHHPDGTLPPSSATRPGQRIVYDGPVFDLASLEHWIAPWIAQARDDKRRGRHVRSWSHGMWGQAKHSGILGQMEWLESEPAPAALGALMAEALCPVAVANSHGLAMENPRLADFQLFRGLDPSSCIQEIAMFVANMANPERDEAPVEDRYKILGHGFDQASFRKQPTKGASPRLAKRPHPGKLS